MANILLVNIDLETAYMQKLIEMFGSHKVGFIDLETEEISACIQCGKCIKRNYCVLDKNIKNISDIAENYDVFVFGTEIIYGEISEKCEHAMTKLMHSSSNLFSHKILLPLFSSRSQDYNEAKMKMSRYIAEAGGILLTSWLNAEVYHTEDLQYAVDELLWVLDGIDFGKKPEGQYQRNLQFTR